MHNLINIFKFLVWIVLIIGVSLLADGVYKVPYVDVNDKIDQDKDVVIIYDKFIIEWDKSPMWRTHGDIVAEIFQSLTNEEDYNLIKTDYRLVKIGAFKNMVNSIKTNKKIFINISFAPDKGFNQQLFAETVVDLADKNITITQATGNWKRSKDINMTVENEINKAIKEAEINNLAFMERKEDLKIDDGWMQSFEKYSAEDTRNIALGNLIGERINPILSHYSIIKEKREKIIDNYIENLIPFSYTTLLQSKKSKVISVSAYTPFDPKGNKCINGKKYDNNLTKLCHIIDIIEEFRILKKNNNLKETSYIDCPIKGLVDNKVRNLGEFFDEDGYYYCGTSGAAPLELAKRFNKYIKSRDEKNDARKIME